MYDFTIIFFFFFFLIAFVVVLLFCFSCYGSLTSLLQKRSKEAQNDLEALKNTSTLYIGNLSFYTTEDQIYELFSKAGHVKKIVMGLDRFNKTPCGFTFVEYETPEEALFGLRYLNQTKLDDRTLQIDLDPGFVEGRQFGRGKSGGQVQDENREYYDAGRGGYGKRWTTVASANEGNGGDIVNYGAPIVSSAAAPEAAASTTDQEPPRVAAPLVVEDAGEVSTGENGDAASEGDYYEPQA